MRLNTPILILVLFMAIAAITGLTFVTSSTAYAVEDDEISASGQYSISDYEQEFNYDDLYILRVELNKLYLLSEAAVGYKTKDGLFLSLSETLEILEFVISFDDTGLKASGWFIKEQYKFLFDLEKNLVFSNNRNYPLDPRYVRIFEDEIFVDISQLQQWFPIEIAFDSLDQVVNVTSLEPLPAELKTAREEKWRSLEQSKRSYEERYQEIDKEDIIKVPYKLATIPFADVKYSYTYDKNADKSEDYNSTLSALMVGDLLYLNHNLFTNFVKGEGITSARITSGQEDYDANLLGPLHATKFEFGDVFMNRAPLISNGQLGKGAIISNYNKNQLTEFDNIPIRGNAQAGWEVELYRNNSLLEFQTIGDDGIYEFLDVPLVSGVNIFKLVFYGPFGERKEETLRYLMDASIVKKGQFNYRLAFNKHNEDFIKVNQDDDPNIRTNRRDGVNRYFAEALYGLTGTTSLAANIVKVPLDENGEQRNFATASLRSSFLGVFGRFDLVKDLSENNYASQTSLKTKIGNYDYTLVFDSFQKGFVSEENIQTSDPVMNNTSLRVVGSFQIPKLPRIRLDLRGEREYRDSGNDVINIDTISSFAIGTKFRFTQNFNYDFDRSQSNPDARNKLFASTLINYRLSNKVSLRGDISYSIDPTEELNSSSLSFDYRLNQGFSYSASVNHIFESSSANQSRTSYTLNLNKSFNRYILSIGGDYDDTGAYGFNANIAFSFGYDPKYQTGTLTGLSIARNGAVSTKVYLDENNNGAFEEEDMPLEDIGFTIDGRDATETTNEDGAALIANLPVGKPQKIDIKADGLPDPYWIPRKVKNHIILHSGVVGFMEFPIIPTGEVDGTVWIYEEGKLKEASNVNIELLDVDGNLIQTVKTSYDGFYLMTYVPYGQYRLRVDQEQLARLGLENGDIYEIALNNDNPIETGNDFIINRVGRDLLPEMYEAGLEEAKPVEEEEKVAVLPLDKAPQIPRKAPVKAKKPKAEEPAIIDDQPYYVVVIKRDDISQGDVDPRAIRRNLREIKNLQYPDMIKVSKRLQVKEKLVEGEYIVIAKGDRAMSLVEKYNLDRKELIKIDDIKNPYIVQIGNRMYLRDAAEFLQADAKMDERRKAKFKDFAKNLAIITRKGEDIASLAKKYKVDKQDLIEANNLQFPYQIKPGQKLYLGKKEERIIDKRKDKISLNNRGRIIADFIRNSDIMTIPNRFKIDGDNVIPLGSLKIPDIIKPIADKVLDEVIVEPTIDRFKILDEAIIIGQAKLKEFSEFLPTGKKVDKKAVVKIKGLQAPGIVPQSNITFVGEEDILQMQRKILSKKKRKSRRDLGTIIKDSKIFRDINEIIDKVDIGVDEPQELPKSDKGVMIKRYNSGERVVSANSLTVPNITQSITDSVDPTQPKELEIEDGKSILDASKFKKYKDMLSIKKYSSDKQASSLGSFGEAPVVSEFVSEFADKNLSLELRRKTDIEQRAIEDREKLKDSKLYNFFFGDSTEPVEEMNKDEDISSDPLVDLDKIKQKGEGVIEDISKAVGLGNDPESVRLREEKRLRKEQAKKQKIIEKMRIREAQEAKKAAEELEEKRLRIERQKRIEEFRAQQQNNKVIKDEGEDVYSISSDEQADPSELKRYDAQEGNVVAIDIMQTPHISTAQQEEMERKRREEEAKQEEQRRKAEQERKQKDAQRINQMIDKVKSKKDEILPEKKYIVKKEEGIVGLDNLNSLGNIEENTEEKQKEPQEDKKEEQDISVESTQKSEGKEQSDSKAFAVINNLIDKVKSQNYDDVLPNKTAKTIPKSAPIVALGNIDQSAIKKESEEEGDLTKETQPVAPTQDQQEDKKQPKEQPKEQPSSINSFIEKLKSRSLNVFEDKEDDAVEETPISKVQLSKAEEKLKQQLQKEIAIGGLDIPSFSPASESDKVNSQAEQIMEKPTAIAEKPVEQTVQNAQEKPSKLIQIKKPQEKVGKLGILGMSLGPRNSNIDLPKVDKSQNEEIKETEIEEEAESEAEKEPQIVGLSIGFEQTPITAETVEKDAQSVKESTQEVKESTQEVKEEAKEEIKKVAKPTKATKREITVKSGDNLWNLAKKHNVKRSEIIKLNNLKPPYNLRVGQKLKLP